MAVSGVFLFTSVTANVQTTPQTTLSMKAEDAQKMARGDINPQLAFMNGTIKVTGDMALAMQFGAAMM